MLSQNVRIWSLEYVAGIERSMRMASWPSSTLHYSGACLLAYISAVERQQEDTGTMIELQDEHIFVSAFKNLSMLL